MRWHGWLLAFTLLCSAPGLQAASIAGVVRDAEREPVPNASIYAVNLTENSTARESKTKVLLATTDFDGQFAFDELPAGTYRICVDKPHMLLLNPCEWGTPPEVVLVDAQSAERIVIPVAYGKAVRVRLDDPEDALAVSAAAKQGDPLVGLAVLDAGGTLHDLRPQAKGRKGKEYEIVVPADTALQLVVNSRNAEFEQSAAESKTKLSKDHAKIPFTVESSATVEKVLRLEMRREKK